MNLSNCRGCIEWIERMWAGPLLLPHSRMKPMPAYPVRAAGSLWESLDAADKDPTGYSVLLADMAPVATTANSREGGNGVGFILARRQRHTIHAVVSMAAS